MVPQEDKLTHILLSLFALAVFFSHTDAQITHGAFRDAAAQNLGRHQSGKKARTATLLMDKYIIIGIKVKPGFSFPPNLTLQIGCYKYSFLTRMFAVSECDVVLNYSICMYNKWLSPSISKHWFIKINCPVPARATSISGGAFQRDAEQAVT